MHNSKYGRFCLFAIALLGVAQQILPIEEDLPSAGQRQESIIGIFAHGYGGDGQQAKYYEPLFNVPLRSFNFPDAQDGYLNSRETSLAQDNEIEALMDECAQHTNNKKILIGVSRGASTIINLLGLHKIPGVRAAILESPFDHVKSIAHHFVRVLPGICRLLRFLPGISSIAHWGTFFVCKKYKRSGVQPINVVDDIPKDLPILFICSQTDTLIPCESTMRLYVRLREAGHEKVHILILEHGRHSNLLRENLYEPVVNAFWKKYGLPHDEQLARRGYSRFYLCQPDVVMSGESSLRSWQTG